MIKLRCLVADDEPFARCGIRNFILRTPFLEHTAAASNTKEVIDILHSTKIDLLFLDIEMPGKKGIDFLRGLDYRLNTIIITAHPQFAAESYELNVIDYLIKPVGYDRFLKAVNKVRGHQTPADDNGPQYLFIKSGTTHEKILVSDIDYIEAKGNYLEVHTAAKSILTYLSMIKVLEVLPSELFLKIHKSYIINVAKVTKIETGQVWLYNKPLPVSRNFREDVTCKLINHRKL